PTGTCSAPARPTTTSAATTSANATPNEPPNDSSPNSKPSDTKSPSNQSLLDPKGHFPSGPCEQPLLHRENRGLGAVGHAELGQHVPDVVLDRLLGDPELERDSLVRPALRDQPQHLALAVGELIQPRRPAPPLTRARQHVDQP